MTIEANGISAAVGLELACAQPFVGRMAVASRRFRGMFFGMRSDTTAGPGSLRCTPDSAPPIHMTPGGCAHVTISRIPASRQLRT
jgi:hypothetical protein